MRNPEVELTISQGNSQTIVPAVDSTSESRAFWGSSNTANMNERPAILAFSQTNVDLMGNLVKR